MATPDTVKPITAEQQQELDEVFARARKALAIIATYDQARVDRLCQAVAWAVANKKTSPAWSRRASPRAASATRSAGWASG